MLLKFTLPSPLLSPFHFLWNLLPHRSLPASILSLVCPTGFTGVACRSMHRHGAGYWNSSNSTMAPSLKKSQ